MEDEHGLLRVGHHLALVLGEAVGVACLQNLAKEGAVAVEAVGLHCHDQVELLTHWCTSLLLVVRVRHHDIDDVAEERLHFHLVLLVANRATGD